MKKGRWERFEHRNLPRAAAALLAAARPDRRPGISVAVAVSLCLVRSRKRTRRGDAFEKTGSQTLLMAQKAHGLTFALDLLHDSCTLSHTIGTRTRTHSSAVIGSCVQQSCHPTEP